MANAPSKNVKSVTRWTPNPSPVGEENLSDYLYSELNRLSDTLINIDLNRIEETNVDPAQGSGKPRSGDIRYADGTNWNPLGEGKGLYIYDGSAWKNLVNQDISSIIISSGNSITIQSGGSVTIQSGGSLTVDSGATITNNGTDSGFGLFESYAIIVDEKAGGTNGGTATTGSWETRDLNTEYADPDSIVSISSNQFTLQSGNYLIEWSAPAFACNRHQSRLYNVTDTSVVAAGTIEKTYTGSSKTRSFGSTRVVIASAKAFEIQHRVDTTNSNDGYGYSNPWGDGTVNVYTIVKIFKEM